jgi:hypothetical protein
MTVALANVVVVRKAIVRDAWISAVARMKIVCRPAGATALKVVVIATTNLSIVAPSAKRAWVATNACLSGI